MHRIHPPPFKDIRVSRINRKHVDSSLEDVVIGSKWWQCNCLLIVERVFEKQSWSVLILFAAVPSTRIHWKNQLYPGYTFKEHTNLDKPTGVSDHCQATDRSVAIQHFYSHSRIWRGEKQRLYTSVSENLWWTVTRDTASWAPPMANGIIMRSWLLVVQSIFKKPVSR